MRTLLTVAFCAWLAAGCAAKSAQMHTLHSAWPQGLPQPQVAQALAAVAGPMVWVEPLALDLGEPAERVPRASARPTEQVLTDLLVQKLRQVGVNVSSEQSEYALQGVVPRLGYSERAGYPRRITYLSQLSYQLVHRPSGAVVWEGNLSQEFEQTVLVNTMTRLPEDPQAPAHVLVDKCVGPTWEAIAQDVSQFLKEQPAAEPGQVVALPSAPAAVRAEPVEARTQ